MIIKNPNIQDKSKDLERLLKMEEMQHVPYIPGNNEDQIRNQEERPNMQEVGNQEPSQVNNINNNMGYPGINPGEMSYQSDVMNNSNNNTYMSQEIGQTPNVPNLNSSNNSEVPSITPGDMGMQQQSMSINQDIQKLNQQKFSMDSQMINQMQQMDSRPEYTENQRNMTENTMPNVNSHVQERYDLSNEPRLQAQQMNPQQSEMLDRQQTVENTNPSLNMQNREVRPLSSEDFPSEKKRIIKETQIESVYQLPHDYKKTIVLLSPESTGKTTMAVNMAWYFNKRGIKTTLIDTDFAKKDIYYHFPIDTAECMSRISSTEDVTKLGIVVDKNLRVYTEHKDVNVELAIYDLPNLITASKRVSQVVIVDLDYNLDPEAIRNVLGIADDIIVVIDQKVTTLNRVPEELYTYRQQLKNVDLIINKFYNIRHLEKERVGDFFRGIEIYNGKTFDIKVNKIFTVADDSRAVVQGLAERTPTIEIRDNKIEKDIMEICNNYYVIEPKKKRF